MHIFSYKWLQGTGYREQETGAVDCHATLAKTEDVGFELITDN